jgi:hypothetical protein
MGLFSRPPKTATAVDGLADPEWFAASERTYQSLVGNYYGSPETMAGGGHERLMPNDAGVAMYLFAKSIDMLHTAYGFNEMRSRRPSDADAAIVGGFCDALALVMRDHASAGVDPVVREVTHRLRSISTTCDGMGHGSNLYRWGLDTMARLAPQVRTDDVYWH